MLNTAITLGLMCAAQAMAATDLTVISFGVCSDNHSPW